MLRNLINYHYVLSTIAVKSFNSAVDLTIIKQGCPCIYYLQHNCISPWWVYGTCSFWGWERHTYVFTHFAWIPASPCLNIAQILPKLARNLPEYHLNFAWIRHIGNFCWGWFFFCGGGGTVPPYPVSYAYEYLWSLGLTGIAWKSASNANGQHLTGRLEYGHISGTLGKADGPGTSPTPPFLLHSELNPAKRYE